MLRVAFRLPPAVGVILTLIEQLAPAANEAPQVVVSLKSPEFVPVMEIPLIVRVSVPVFVSVTVCAAVEVPRAVAANVSVEGERDTVGAVPVPDRDMVCGEEAALSLTLSVAVRAPLAVGLNATLIEQFAPAAKLAPQVLFSVKSDALAPPTVTLEIVSDAVPVFVKVAICDPLVVPTACAAKVSEEGVNDASGVPGPVEGVIRATKALELELVPLLVV